MHIGKNQTKKKIEPIKHYYYNFIKEGLKNKTLNLNEVIPGGTGKYFQKKNILYSIIKNF